MAPTAPVSRKAKRKNERDEKKRSRNKRQRRNDEQPAASTPAHKSGSKPRDGGSNRKRPQTANGQHRPNNSSRIQNKFHELLQETTGLSSAFVQRAAVYVLYVVVVLTRCVLLVLQ